MPDFRPPSHLAPYFCKPMISFNHWRETVLKPFIIERENGLCWVESCFNNGHSLHEGVVTKGDVSGWRPKKNRSLINCPYNCVWICQEHHIHYPSREDVLVWMIEQYGTDVIMYFSNLPFRHNPIQGLIDYYRKAYNV